VRNDSRSVAAQASTILLVAAGSMGIIFLAFNIVARFGLLAFGGFAAMAIGLVFLDRPGVLLTAAIALGLLCQFRSTGLLGPTGVVYEPIALISPFEALLFLLLVSVVLDCWRKRRFRPPDPFTGPLVILAGAIVAGCIVGYANGASIGTLRTYIQPLVITLVAPFLVANAVHGENEVRRLLTGIAAMTLLLSLLGLAGVATGRGAAEFDGTQATFYVATPVWAMMVYVLTVLAATLMRVKLPRWVSWSWPLPLVALTLSFERGFWLGTIAAVVLVIVFATGPLGRRLAVPAVIVAIVVGLVVFSSGVTNHLNGPLVDRAESLQPQKVLTNKQDNYRIGERHNVIAEIDEAPITGLGFGIHWRARHGISVDIVNARMYVHTAFLFWWLKMGILGAIAYISLMLTSFLTALRMRKRAADPVVRAWSAAVSAATVGIVVVELTATHLGVDPAFGFIFGTAWGVLAVVRAESVPVAAREPTVPLPSSLPSREVSTFPSREVSPA
jgi:O-Antigen ligase